MKLFELFMIRKCRELFRYDLISFDGISYKSGNTSEYELRDKPEPEALTSVSPY